MQKRPEVSRHGGRALRADCHRSGLKAGTQQQEHTGDVRDLPTRRCSLSGAQLAGRRRPGGGSEAIIRIGPKTGACGRSTGSTRVLVAWGPLVSPRCSGIKEQ